jgi:hypothetical protein
MSDTLERFRQAKEQLRAPERSKHRAELLKRMRLGAVTLVGLSSEIPAPGEPEQSMAQLLAELSAKAEQLKRAAEENIAMTLAMADNAAELWEATWQSALRNPGEDRAAHTMVLRWVLEETEEELREWLRVIQEDAGRIGRPLARLEELQAKAAEFHLWAQECLARWEMLDEPAPDLDPERVARAQAAYARGEYESLDDVLSRVEEGGPWVKE